jgi:hypothetical protein
MVKRKAAAAAADPWVQAHTDRATTAFGEVSEPFTEFACAHAALANAVHNVLQ